MTNYTVRYTVTAEVVVRLAAETADQAEDQAWEIGEDYIDSLTPDNRGASIHLTLDGLAASSVEETR